MFDQIVCTGVLHPSARTRDIGLRSLRAVLAPNGAMHLMVYATYGRARHLHDAGVTAACSGSAPRRKELRDLGATIGALSSDHPIAGVSRRGEGFQKIRTHSPMHCSTLRIVPTPCRSSMRGLQRCGISFGALVRAGSLSPAMAARMARTPHAARLVSLSSQLQHATVELFTRDHDQAQLHRLFAPIAWGARARRSHSRVIALAGATFSSASAVDLVHPGSGSPGFRWPS